jgi:dinuclear metal center YbgI/SA1388 family protein
MWSRWSRAYRRRSRTVSPGISSRPETTTRKGSPPVCASTTTRRSQSSGGVQETADRGSIDRSAYDARVVPTVQDIAQAFAELTDPDGTPHWDPVGLQLGDPGAEVSSVGVCHEVTEDVVAALEEKAVDLLVTYHPLLFTPTTRVLAGRSAEARSYRLIRAGISLLVTHTDFDAAPGGTADSLAAFFDLRDTEPFGADPDSGLPAIGRVGSFEGTLGTIDAMLTDEFGPVGLRVSGDRNREVQRLAVVPGSGDSLVEEAALLADALVTGDVSHHKAVSARDQGLAVVDPGHVATERPGMPALVEMVSRVSSADVVDLTDFDPQTWD